MRRGSFAAATRPVFWATLSGAGSPVPRPRGKPGPFSASGGRRARHAAVIHPRSSTREIAGVGELRRSAPRVPFAVLLGELVLVEARLDVEPRALRLLLEVLPDPLL